MCDSNAKCTNGRCVCDAGYQGDGQRCDGRPISVFTFVKLTLLQLYHIIMYCIVLDLMGLYVFVLYCIVGVSNGPIQLQSARKIWPFICLICSQEYTGAHLLVLAKFLQVRACSDSRAFCIFLSAHCSQEKIEDYSCS